MAVKLFRETVAKSSNSKLLEGLQVTVSYSHINVTHNLEGITGIYKYFKNQKEAWEAKDEIPPILQRSKEHFIQSTNQIANFINNNSNWDENTFQRNWLQLQQRLQAPTYQNQPVLTGDSPVTDFLIGIHKEFPQSFASAYQYIIQNSISNINNRNQLIGFLLAYEFDLQDHTDIKKRRTNERISLAHIRNSFEDRLNEAEGSVQEAINKVESEFKNYSSNIDELKQNKEKLFDEWFEGSKESFNSFHEDANKKAENLKEVFKDTLRFTGPVRYWKRRALRMKEDGAKWMKWFIGSIILTAASIFILLWLIPDSMTTSLFNGDASAIKWTLLFVTFISFMAYGVRTFAKLTFSCYHLARDAEEREQLTHVYLALKKDANVEEEDRLVILQALFSRAETGLLKNDSAPTMPATLLEKIRSV